MSTRPTSSATPRHRRAVTSMLAMDVVRDVAERLAGLDIEVMPIKGALLQHWLYDDPADRAMTDVDLLIPPSALGVAVVALIDAGYVLHSTTTIGARVLRSPRGLAVDLHPRLFDDVRYRLSSAAVFARSTTNDTLFGARVRLPAPLDAYAHLIGKFGSDHQNARCTRRLDEIVRMGSSLRETPEQIAHHLVDVGMRRVARYVLPLAASAGDDTARRTWAALPPDPVGVVVVSVAAAMLRSSYAPFDGGALAAHLLNHSMAAATRSGVSALRARMR